MYVDDAIGNTPLVRVRSLTTDADAEVWIKLEGANPTGSMKDRMALAMVDGALRRGDLQPGGMVVELTGGSTGSSLAFICAARGLRASFVSSDAYSAEKLATMRAFGAELDVVRADASGIDHELFTRMLERVHVLAGLPGAFWTDQFTNPDNAAAYRVMADEICDQLGAAPDAFVMGVGTGGCFSGNAERLRERRSDVQCVAVEPLASRALSGGPVQGHHIEGIAPGFVTSITRTDLIDEIEAVSDEDAAATARGAARDEGLFAGTSTGANLCAARRVAERLGAGHRVVTVACDSGLKYLQGHLYRGPRS